MEVLHVQWMDLPGPTDVMSFPMDELRPGREGQEPERGHPRRHRALPVGRDEAGGRRRSRADGGDAAAHDARHPAPARLRPRRARRGDARCSSCSASCCSPSSPRATARAPDRGRETEMFPQFALPALISIVVAFLLLGAPRPPSSACRGCAPQELVRRRSVAARKSLHDRGRRLTGIPLGHRLPARRRRGHRGGARHPGRRRPVRVDVEPRPHQHRDHGGRVVRRRRRLAAHPRPAELRHRRAVERPLRRRPAPRARPGGQAARRARQRGHARQGLHRRAVPDRVRAARPRRHGR